MKISPITLLMLSYLMGCGVTQRLPPSPPLGSSPGLPPASPPGITPPPNIRPQEANVVSLDPENWYIYYSPGVPPHPSADIEGAWSFDFPSSGAGGHVNYVQTPFNATTPLHNVSITFRIESSTPQFKVLDTSDILPATIHLFLEQQGDDLVNANGRWWALASGYNLGSQDNQTMTFVVPLTSDQWSNVYGQHDPQAFSASLENIGWVGLTCGGQYFWGHGVALVSGSAKFILIDFRVN
jgi:hypothetical protein